LKRAALLALLALAACRGSVEPSLPVLLLAADAGTSRIVFIRSAAVLPPAPGDAAGAIAGALDLGGARPWDLAIIPERDRLLVALTEPDGSAPRVHVYDTSGLNTIAPSLSLVTSVSLPPFDLPAGTTPPNVDPSPRRLAVGPGGRFVAVASAGRLDEVLGEVPAVIDLLDLDAATPYLADARLISGRPADLAQTFRLVVLVTADLLVVALPFDDTETLDGYLQAYSLADLTQGKHDPAWIVNVPSGQLVNPTDLLALDGTEVAVLATPGTGPAAVRVIDSGLENPVLGPPENAFEGADRLLRFGGELVFARRAGDGGPSGAVRLPGESTLRTIGQARAFAIAPTGYLHVAGFAPLPPADPDGVVTTLDLALIRAGVTTGTRLDLALPGLGEVEALATVIVSE
jgi:hypothetical protein